MNAGALRSRPAARRGALALALLGAAASCAREESARDPRWAQGAPSDELTLGQLTEVRCVYERAFRGTTLPEGVRISADAAIFESSAEGGTTMRGGYAAPVLSFDRRFAAGEIDSVRVVATDLRRGRIRLRWRRPGGPELDHLDLARESGSGTRRDHFLFDLRGKLPAGEPVELELEPTTAAGEVVTVEAFCAGKGELARERIDVAAKVPWKATLADDSRDALLVPASGEIVWRGRVPRDATLGFGVGLLSEASHGLAVRLESAAPGEARRPVFERAIPAEDLRMGWRDLKVPLDSARGANLELTLSLRPAGAAGAPPAAPVAALVSIPRFLAGRRHVAQPNLVLISLDTLRADHLSLYGYPRPTSPRLDAWVRGRRSVVFRQVVPPSGWTLPSHFSLFTGLEAFRHPANYHNLSIDPSAFTMLAQLLRETGYRTQAFTGGGFVHPIYGLARGFDSFVYWAAMERRAEELRSNLDRATAWLDQSGDDPFLLFLHTYEIHTPNAPRQPFFARMSELPPDLTVDVALNPAPPETGFLGDGHPVVRRRAEDPPGAVPPGLENLPRDVYDSAIAYTDEKLAPFLQKLSRPPFANDTIVVLFSDHGESFGETGRWGHGNLTIANLRVPMIVVLPGAGTAREVPSQVRLLDLFPSLLEWARVAVPAGTDGASLTALVRGGSEPGGRAAWAYSASTNHGLAWLSPDGWKLDWRNSVWKPVAGELHWYRTREFAEEELEAPPPAVDAAAFRREVESRYAREGIGLQLEVANQAALPLRIGISSDLIDPASVKSPRIDGQRATWRYVGRLEEAIEAGDKLELRLERALRRSIELAIDVRRDGCDAAASVRIATTAEALRREEVRRVGLPCAAGAGPPGAGVEVRLRWRGPLPGAARASGDRKLEKDLAALGYLH